MALGMALNADRPTTAERLTVGLILVAGQNLPLVWRRRSPLATLLLLWTAESTYAQLGFPSVLGSGLALLVGVYSVASNLSPPVSWAGAVVVALMLVGYLGDAVARRDPTAAFYGYGSYAVAWLFGDAVRQKQSHLRALAERADESARRLVAAERSHIARELHDILSHYLSVLVIQAAAARRVLRTDVDQAAELLGNIANVGQSALEDSRRIFGLLRGDEGPLDLAPQPGLDALEELCETSRQAGLEVHLDLSSAPMKLQPALELCVYRIAQESLTNVRRHSNSTHADLTISLDEGGWLDVSIVDPGPANEPSPAQPGRGLLGMRERVAAFEGSLTTGSDKLGGFAVRARFPIDRRPIEPGDSL
jgi:signal transduction histidine kinase